MNIRRFISDLLPPMAKRILRRQETGCTWTGSYPDWISAASAAQGYDQQEIQERVEDATCQVLAGKALFERDGVPFHKSSIRWAILGACWISFQRHGRLRVIDVGGSLGSVWLQHRHLLAPLKTEWRIVEQAGFVSRGSRLFPDGSPSFHDSIDAACHDGIPELVLLSGVLQYLEDPHGVLRKITSIHPPMLVIDRTSEIQGANNRISIQRVPKHIYQASYPCWLFAAGQVPLMVGPGYRVLAPCPEEDHAPGSDIRFPGWVFESVENAQ